MTLEETHDEDKEATDEDENSGPQTPHVPEEIMLGDCQETLQAIVRVGNIHNNPP
jgi:hypothetical protein